MGTNSERERSIARLAFDQHGVVALSQLHRTRIRSTSGRATGPGRAPTQDSPGGLRRGPQRDSAGAAIGGPPCLAYGDQALLSHRSAAAILGTCQAAFVVQSTSPHRLDGKECGGARASGSIEASFTPRTGPNGRGYRSPAVARTLFDYAEVADFGRLERAWEEADRLKLLRLGEIERGLRARLRPARPETDQAPARRSPRRHPDPLPARGPLPELRRASTSCRRTARTSTSSAKRSTCSGPPPS